MVDTLSTFRTTDDHAMLPSVGFSEPHRPSTYPATGVNRRTPPPLFPPFIRRRPYRLKDRDDGFKTRETDDASAAEGTELQSWNDSFVAAVHAESLGLVGRATALKGPDGQWQGVALTVPGERGMITTGEWQVASMWSWTTLR